MVLLLDLVTTERPRACGESTKCVGDSVRPGYSLSLNVCEMFSFNVLV